MSGERHLCVSAIESCHLAASVVVALFIHSPTTRQPMVSERNVGRLLRQQVFACVIAAFAIEFAVCEAWENHSVIADSCSFLYLYLYL